MQVAAKSTNLFEQRPEHFRFQQLCHLVMERRYMQPISFQVSWTRTRSGPLVLQGIEEALQVLALRRACFCEDMPASCDLRPCIVILKP